MVWLVGRSETLLAMSMYTLLVARSVSGYERGQQT